MKLLLSLDEFRLLCRGITMFVCVPFRPGMKPEMTAKAKDALNRMYEEMGDIIVAKKNAPPPSVEFDLALDEIGLLKTVIQADINQCGTDDNEITISEYSIHFASEREKVEALLAKLVTSQ